MISDRLLLLHGDISSNSRAAESSVLVLRLSYFVLAVLLYALAKVSVSLKFLSSGLSVNTFTSVPGSVSLHVSDSENLVLEHAVVHSLS
jgi:hypothetical protein